MATFRYSDFIQTLSSLDDNQPVVLWCRESGDWQRARKNLDNQIADLHEKVEPRPVLEVFTFIGRATDPETLRELDKAIAFCRKHEVPLVVDEVSRLIRHEHYNPKTNHEVQPTLEQMEDMARRLRGVRVFSVLPPDADSGEQRSVQIIRGQKYKGRKGGYRGPRWTILRKEKCLGTILKMWRQGSRLREIEKAVNVPFSTIGRWIRAATAGVPSLPPTSDDVQ